MGVKWTGVVTIATREVTSFTTTYPLRGAIRKLGAPLSPLSLKTFDLSWEYRR
jgi:hypothetical protein